MWSDLQRPPLRQEALRAAIVAPGGLWTGLDVVAETGSTNADLLARAAAGTAPAGSVLTTDHQSAGRGRLTRQWTSPPRSSVVVSVLVATDGVPEGRVGWLPLLAGVAVVDALTRRCGLAARLKWPNDVLVEADGEPRKVCGILAEVVPGSGGGGTAVVVGAGINVSQVGTELPVPTATSLLLAGAATTDRDTVLRAYLRAFEARYRAWTAAAGDPRGSGLGPAYREACATLGSRVSVHLPDREPLEGLAEEVDDDGRLVVRDDAGTLHLLSAGDVVHVRPGKA